VQRRGGGLLRLGQIRPALAHVGNEFVHGLHLVFVLDRRSVQPVFGLGNGVAVGGERLVNRVGRVVSADGFAGVVSFVHFGLRQ
jgi:hypothetical protein